MMKRKSKLFAAAIAACAAVAFSGAASAQEKLLIGATSASSSQYGYFVALSQLINAKVPGVESSVVDPRT